MMTNEEWAESIKDELYHVRRHVALTRDVADAMEDAANAIEAQDHIKYDKALARRIYLGKAATEAAEWVRGLAQERGRLLQEEHKRDQG